MMNQKYLDQKQSVAIHNCAKVPYCQAVEMEDEKNFTDPRFVDMNI